MIKILTGMFISYGIFNEKGRKMLNSMGNVLLKKVDEVIKKPVKGENDNGTV